MSRPAAPSERRREILHAIVREYIETGEPVASRSVARRRRDSLSAASVRNIMADLGEEGYLSQPHTSAGRVPTAKAFRSYVMSLSLKRPDEEEMERLRAELRDADRLEAWLERSSRILTEMTRNVGITAAIPTSSQSLDQIELLALAEKRVLVIVVTRDRMVRNRVVSLDEAVGQPELDSIRNYVNRNFGGWTLTAVRAELARRLEQESAAYDAVLKGLTALFEKGMLDIGLSPEVHLEGVSYLVSRDLHLTREKMRDLLRALEEKKRLLQLLDRFLEQPDGELAVEVGLQEVHPTMRDLALIGLCVTLPGGLSAKVAVLGPMRLDYERVMSSVLQMGQVFQGLPA